MWQNENGTNWGGWLLSVYEYTRYTHITRTPLPNSMATIVGRFSQDLLLGTFTTLGLIYIICPSLQAYDPNVYAIGTTYFSLCNTEE